ncbi:cytochrome b [Sphingorhabdus sp.]|uniref:cytochrome b n=1 Tax=Sphingorhabdus sp. TaxID=1902408 RepID=UPI003918B4A4
MIGRLRAWGNSHTERGRYSPVGIAFHWIMALLVVFQIGWGFWSDFLLPGGGKIRAYEIHSAAGLPILLLAIGRVLWRMLINDPYNDADGQGVKTTIAHVTAILFYATFFTLPLSGWAMWSSVAPPGPLYLGGLIPWPQLPLDGFQPLTRYHILDLAEDVHIASVILLLVLIPAHVGAALKHHFWDRDDVLQGMLPEIPDWQGRPVTPPHIAPASPSPKGSGVG